MAARTAAAAAAAAAAAGASSAARRAPATNAAAVAAAVSSSVWSAGARPGVAAAAAAASAAARQQAPSAAAQQQQRGVASSSSTAPVAMGPRRRWLEAGRKNVARKYLEGVVVGVGFMEKTVTVATRRPVAHPRTRKIINFQTKYLVHDEDGICDLGDRVKIAQSRRFSKRKSHQIHEIVRKNAAAAFLKEHPEYLHTQSAERAGKGRRILLRTYDYLRHEGRRVATGKQHMRAEEYRITEPNA